MQVLFKMQQPCLIYIYSVFFTTRITTYRFLAHLKEMYSIILNTRTFSFDNEMRQFPDSVFSLLLIGSTLQSQEPGG